MLIDYIYILILHEAASGGLVQGTDQFCTHLALEMLQPALRYSRTMQWPAI